MGNKEKNIDDMELSDEQLDQVAGGKGKHKKKKRGSSRKAKGGLKKSKKGKKRKGLGKKKSARAKAKR